MLGIAAAALCPGGAVRAAASSSGHADAIRAYATLAAMAQTASDRCNDLLVNKLMIAQMPASFRLSEADEPMARFSTALEMMHLDDTITQAPSLKGWCDAALRAYGPSGTIVPNLLSRDPELDDPN